MRVASLGWVAESETEVLDLAEKSLHPTHVHPQSLKGAQAVALGVWLARRGRSKEEMRHRLEQLTGWNLRRKLDDIRPTYEFDISCEGSIPEAIIAFFESDSYEDALRNSVSLGGDADTQACIAGALAEAFYGGVPDQLAQFALEVLPEGWPHGH